MGSPPHENVTLMSEITDILTQLMAFNKTYEDHITLCRRYYNQAEQGRYDRGVLLWDMLLDVRRVGKDIIASVDRRYDLRISMASYDWTCTCPDAKTAPCKHIVALATYWERCRVVPAQEKLKKAVLEAQRTILEG